MRRGFYLRSRRSCFLDGARTYYEARTYFEAWYFLCRTDQAPPPLARLPRRHALGRAWFVVAGLGEAGRGRNSPGPRGAGYNKSGKAQASTAGLRVELATRHTSWSGLGVKIGGVLRGVLPRSSALRASGGGARNRYLMPLFFFCRDAICGKNTH